MRHLVFTGPAKLEWREVPAPALVEPTDALVRPVAVALCDIDRAAISGIFPLDAPVSFGHEFVAEVVQLGDSVQGLEIGQLVMSPVQISCGQCRHCTQGLTAYCTSVEQPAAWGLGVFGGHWPGAFADLVRVPYAGHMLVPVPDGIYPTTVASVGDNIADAWRTVAPFLAESEDPADVLVVGGGSIGLYAASIATACGASRVDYVDDDLERLELAQRLGARAVESPLGRRAGTYSITVSASFAPDAVRTAILSTRPAGVCTSVFPPGLDDVKLPLWDMWRRTVDFRIGVANCRAHMPDVLDLVVSGAIHPELVTSEQIEWDDAPRALLDPSLKPVVVRDLP